MDPMYGDPLDYQAAAKRARVDPGAASEPEILRLVAQREAHRQARRFAESDSIREELRAMGVELFDKEKEWRAADGRRGTLFTAGAQECVLMESEIQDRIRDREEARRSKDWVRGDAIRDELRLQGVELDDKEAVWRTSNGRTGNYSGAPRPPAGTQIRRLVAERERLRSAQDFESADDLRRQLAALGVELFDSERLWRTSDGQQGVIITGGCEVDCRLSDFEITNHVVAREDARSQKNWAQADAIRDDLRAQGVELLDNQRVWCTTDGRHGSFTPGQAAPPIQIPSKTSSVGMAAPLMSAPPQAAPGGAGLGNALVSALGGNDAAVAAVLQLLAPQMTQQYQPQLAPALAPAPAPRLPTSAVTSSPSALTFCDHSITALVMGREAARERHDWAAADNIRNDLRTHGVDVWDKEKLWRANDGRSGVITRPTSGFL